MEFIINITKLFGFLIGGFLAPFWFGILTGTLKRSKVSILNPHLMRSTIVFLAACNLWCIYTVTRAGSLTIFIMVNIFLYCLGTTLGALNPKPFYFMKERFKSEYPPPE